MTLTLTEMETLVSDWLATEAELDAQKKAIIAPLQTKLDALEGKLLEQLEAAGIKSYSAKAVTVTRAVRYTVATPKTPAEKGAYFDWVRGKSEDLYWAQMSVNSQTLNSFYKEQMEIAKDAGDMDFAIPGLGEPQAKPYLMRRKR